MNNENRIEAQLRRVREQLLDQLEDGTFDLEDGPGVEQLLDMLYGEGEPHSQILAACTVIDRALSEPGPHAALGAGLGFLRLCELAGPGGALAAARHLSKAEAEMLLREWAKLGGSDE